MNYINPSRRVLTLCHALVFCLGGLVILPGCNSDGNFDPTDAIGAIIPTPPTPREAVLMTFDKDDADRRREGINWLSAAPFGGEENYVGVYRLMWNDPVASVRAAAARALGAHGSVEDAAQLMLLLEDENLYVRWQAARGLRMIHNPAAAAPLMRLLDDEEELDSDVRQAAADALGQYATRDVFNALTRTLEDRNYAVLIAAHKSLVTLTGYDAGYDPRDWSAWAQDNPETIFRGQQVYTYAPYQRPRGWTDDLLFWRDDETPEPQRPTGIELAEG